MTNRHRADVHARCTRVGVRTRQRQRARTRPTLRQTETPRHHTRHRPRRRVRNLHRRISRQRHRARQRARRREIHRTSRRQTRTSNRQRLCRAQGAATCNLERGPTCDRRGSGNRAKRGVIADHDGAVIDAGRTRIGIGCRQRQRAGMRDIGALGQRSDSCGDWVCNCRVTRPNHCQCKVTGEGTA